ncbi:MAG TPA: histidine kinase [Pyrinomonadaceae bacterium]|nr:histidine kinase [Pyrinomonadaceae bacterium]
MDRRITATSESIIPPRAGINWPLWLILFGFWTLFSFLNANQIYFEMLHNPNMHHSWWRIAFWQLVIWYLWGFLSPLILQMGRRFPVEGRARIKGLVIHLLTCVALAAVQIAGATALRMIIRPFDDWSDTHTFLIQYQRELSNFFLINVLVYWAIFGVGYAFDYREKYREREAQAAELKAQLTRAQLESLKMQLQPHFLFNTLHTIAGLVRGNEKVPAVNMISGLSDLLRRTLESADEQEVPLKEEVKFVELYLDIQKVRFSDRLAVQIDVVPETQNALVPNLFLQPLVENAIRHGVSQQSAPGLIKIESFRDNGNLQITVTDNGPGLRENYQHERSGGIGLTNTSERLERLYGKRHRFDLRNCAGGGTEATVVIPFRIHDREV